MPNPDEQARMEGQVLQKLYEPFFLSFDGYDLKRLLDQEGWERVTFDNVLHGLSSRGFIRYSGGGYNCLITGKGAVYAEQLGVAPAEFVRTNERVRTGILLALAKVYEEKGRLYSKYKRELEDELGVGKNVVTGNLLVLDDLGYAEPTENGHYRITDYGLAAVAEYRKVKDVADEFERISNLAPQGRGRALQKLIARAVKLQGWEADEGVRTSHEEMDVIVWREREYYLLECKWENERIEAAVVRELFGKLGNRIGVNGIVMSVSGFTSGAGKQAEDYAGQRLILLFGEDGIKRMVYGKESFTDLLDTKYRLLTTKRKAELT